MATRSARVGVHGRNDYGSCKFEEKDYELIREARIEHVKMMISDQAANQGVLNNAVGVCKRLREINPDMDFVVRLDDPHHVNEGGHPTPQVFANRFIPIMKGLHDACPYVVKFEVLNEPNHIGGLGGWGPEADKARDFSRWFLETYDRLKAACPWASLGFPGLAIPHGPEPGLDLDWIEICRDAVERSDWLGVHCFTAGMLVTMGDGTVRPIEDVEVGDEVVTHLGRVRKVTRVSKRPYTGRLFTMKVVGSEPITCTPEHPFWVKRRGVARKYLSKAKPPEWLDVDHMREGDYACCPRMLNLPPVEYDEDQLWVMGLWLAEGSCCKKSPSTGDHYTLLFSMGPDERPALEKARAILQKWFKRKSGSIHETKSGLELHFPCVEATRLFKQLLGYGAPTKRMRPELFQRSGLIPLVRGFVAGDGHVKTDDTLVLSTTSPDLAFQLRQVLLNEGRFATLGTRKRKSPDVSEINGRGVWHNRTEWVIEIRPKHAQGLYPFNKPPNGAKRKREYSWNYEEDGAVWPLVRQLDWSETHEPVMVYNLEVEEDHSYLVNGVAAHNCYWQNPTHADRNHLNDFWGLRFKAYHQKFPDKVIEITEFGNSNGQSNYPVEPDRIAREYVEYYRELFNYPYINSAASFIMSSPDATWGNQGFTWRKENGEFWPVVRLVGAMERPPLVPAAAWLITQLQREARSLRQQAAASQATIAQLQQEIQGLRQQAAASREMITQLQRRVDTLRQQLVTATTTTPVARPVVPPSPATTPVTTPVVTPPPATPPAIAPPPMEDVTTRLRRHPVKRFDTRTLDQIKYLVI
ncbi:MAG TPA: hypothetical protein EYP49_08680, partial [Anaerolineae bacterium]|nr:hypothetical protein [Anaerolineae bacterium]